MDYETAFKKPFTCVKKLIVGILLGIVPIINFFVSGYIVETARRTMKKDFELPEWRGWGELFVSGLLYTVIGFIYTLPALAVGLISLWPMLPSLYSYYISQIIPNAAVQAPDLMQIMAGMGNMMAGILLALLFLLLAVYAAPSAILHFAGNDFGSAFRLGSVFRTAFTKDYFLAWLVFAVYSVALSGLLSRIPFIGSAFATFVAGITGFTLLAESFSPAEAMPLKKADITKKKRK